MYIVDKIDKINGLMVCEDLDTNELVTIPLIQNVKEGFFIKKVDNEYIIDFELTNIKRNEIKSKLDYLKNRSKI